MLILSILFFLFGLSFVNRLNISVLIFAAIYGGIVWVLVDLPSFDGPDKGGKHRRRKQVLGISSAVIGFLGGVSSLLGVAITLVFVLFLQSLRKAINVRVVSCQKCQTERKFLPKGEEWRCQTCGTMENSTALPNVTGQ